MRRLPDTPGIKQVSLTSLSKTEQPKLPPEATEVTEPPRELPSDHNWHIGTPLIDSSGTTYLLKRWIGSFLCSSQNIQSFPWASAEKRKLPPYLISGTLFWEYDMSRHSRNWKRLKTKLPGNFTLTELEGLSLKEGGQAYCLTHDGGVIDISDKDPLDLASCWWKKRILPDIIYQMRRAIDW
jgi:hypothetical protein